MTFPEWQALEPIAAAREFHRRLATLLPPAQQRAAMAHRVAEEALISRFATAAQGPGALLSRVPYLAKDLFDVGGVPTFAGSTFLPEVRPTREQDGAFVRAMTAAGAVLAGKTHTHEFAYGITGENPHYGDCEVPGFPGRTTGGSSSGSAAAVAAGVVPLALASDTGGSVRLPAAFCGLYGFRVAPRNAWIQDAVPLAATYDTAGWFTANAADMRTSVQALCGVPRGPGQTRGSYIEMPGLDPEVAVACRAAAERLAAPAAPGLRDELLRGFAASVDTYNTIVAQEAWEVHRGWADRYRDRYTPAVWQRLVRVQSLTPAQIDAANVHTRALHELWRTFFLTHDFLVMAASPLPAMTKAECTLENRGRILTVTAPASIGGLPVLTIPVPLASGLTTGLQIIVDRPTSAVIDWALQQAS